MYEHGEVWLNDADGKTANMSTRALWFFYQQSYIVAKQEELVKDSMI
jgi:hypothetical protein